MALPATRTLEAFVAAARLGSFAAAGARVAMSVPALSRRIARLEADLGVRLLERGPRGVSPTTAGAAYLAHAAAALERLRDAADEARRDAAVVRVTTIPALATRWLAPRLPAFADRHPGVDVDVRTSVAFERLEGGCDLAIRLALDAEMATPPLLPIRLLPVWSAARPLPIERPSDVLRQPLLGPDHRPEFWCEWLRAKGLDAGAEPRPLDPLLLYERALGGAGVAIGIEPLVSALLREGRLTGLTAHRVRSTRGFHLVAAPSAPTRAARLFAAWLEEQARDQEEGEAAG